MAVRTRSLALGNALVPALGLVLTVVPADRTAIIKDVVLVNSTNAQSTLTLQLRRGGVTIGVVRGTVADADRVINTQRFIVAHPGDEIRLHSTVNAGTVGWSISGTLLEGAPV